MDYYRRAIRILGIIYTLGKIVAVIFILGVLIHNFAYTFFIVSGPSMETSFHDKELLLGSRINIWTGKFNRGDPMILKFPGDPAHKKYIKRLIGMPGDEIELKNDVVFLNGKRLYEGYLEEGTPTLPDNPAYVSLKLKDNEYYLMGDNRLNSSDSRTWGVANKDDLIGPVRWILWPPGCFSAVAPFTY